MFPPWRIGFLHFVHCCTCLLPLSLSPVCSLRNAYLWNKVRAPYYSIWSPPQCRPLQLVPWLSQVFIWPQVCLGCVFVPVAVKVAVRKVLSSFLPVEGLFLSLMPNSIATHRNMSWIPPSKNVYFCPLNFQSRLASCKLSVNTFLLFIFVNSLMTGLFWFHFWLLYPRELCLTNLLIETALSSYFKWSQLVWKLYELFTWTRNNMHVINHNVLL